MMKQTLLTLLLIANSVLIFAQNQPDDKAFTGTLTILHTNDIHANLDRFPRLAFVVDSIREKSRHVLLMNAGDIFTGNPLVDMNTEKGIQMIELMNRVGYDVSALGNHEFDYGQVVLSKRISEAKFPFICANIWNRKDTFELPQAFCSFIIDNKLRINIIGLLDNSINGIPETHPQRVKGLLFTNPVETAEKFEHLRLNADLFIALTHLGDNQDIELAKRMPSFDLIIGGHTHSKIDSNLFIGDILIAQASSYLNFLGEIKVDFKDGKVVKKTSQLIELNKNGNVKPEIEKLVEKYKNNPMFKEIIGKADEDMKGKEELGCFFTDALREVAGLDIAFQNSGGLRIDDLPKGDIKMENIFKLDPFGNYLMVLEMDVKEIESIVRYSFEKWGIDLRVSGMKYTIVTKNDKIKEIIMTDNQGNKLSDKKRYKVGMNDYILSSYNFEHKDQGQSFGITTSEALITYLKKKKNINYKGVQRTFHKKE